MPKTATQEIQYPAHGGPVQLFYSKRGSWRRPTVARAEGVYMWDTDGRRYIDASSGPVVSNIGHGNVRVREAMIAQSEKVVFANRAVFENEPNIQLSNLITSLAGKGLERAFFVSGGSEANEAAIKIARHHAVVTGATSRWKVIAREPGFHGTSLGAVAVTGDPIAAGVYGDMVKTMPKVPAPFRYRVPANFDAQSYSRHCAQALEDTIVGEGAETILAFIMEPVGGLATGALVADDDYYTAVRRICDRYGVLLIYDEVMSGAGRTGKFLAAEHWPAGRPDIVTLAKGIAAGYTPMGAVLAPAAMVEALAEAGGFLHGHTYAANPLSCAIGHAVVQEMVAGKMMENAERMGLRLREGLEALQQQSGILGDVRGKDLLMAIEIVANKETKAILPPERQAVYRIIQLGIERGILLYSRRTANGKYGEWIMVSPPLIITEAQIDEMLGLIGETLAAYESELKQAGAI
jgi:adenosylmethionine-8-amino-7-oxononanoate aminotransferase